MHIIRNHLRESDEFNDLADYIMQAVDKNNDVLLRLYFSSTNSPENTLLTTLQKLFRMPEMNCQSEKERESMAAFA